MIGCIMQNLSFAPRARVEKAKEGWLARAHRMAGDISLLEPKPDVAKAEAHFNRALDVARKQQANPGNCALQ